MPDRYDPKFPVRPLGDRAFPEEGSKGPRGGKSAKSDDPLVELARIVSGRSPLESTAGRPERAPPPSSSQDTATPSGQHQPLPSEADLARDLEAELLNELQASFSTIPEIVGRPPSPAKPAPPQPPRQLAPAAPRETPPPLDGFADEPPEQPEAALRPPAARPAENTAPRQGQAGQLRPEMLIRPPQGAKRRESLATRIARAAQGGEKSVPPPEAARPETPEPPRPPAQQPARPGSFRPASSETRSSAAGNAQFRPTIAPNPPRVEPAPPPAPRQAATRWDPPLEPPSQAQAPFDVSRFAPQHGDGFAPDTHDLPGEEAFFEELPFAATEEGYFEEMPEGETYDIVPGYGDPDLVPYPGEELGALQPRRSRRGPLAIAALLTIAVIGGAAVVMLRSGGSNETPPIITADASPTKVTPDNTGSGEAEGQAKLIYDRVDPGSEVAGSQLVVPDSAPIADIPPIPGESDDSDVSRVILGGGPGFDEQSGEGDPSAPMDLSGGMNSAAASGEPIVPIGPKKVRTVVVRPDGTIVSSEATSAEEDIGTINEPPPPSATPPAPGAEDNPLLSENFGSEAIGSSSGDVSSEDAGSASVPDIPPPPPPTPAPRASAPSTPTIVATTGSSKGPIDLTPGTSPSGTTGSSAGLGGGFMVQVSSQRSEATALETFSELQRRYPGILGDRQPNIQRADLGERGVYYRVRVGYRTRDEAVQMCEDLKAAGGDCLLASR